VVAGHGQVEDPGHAVRLDGADRVPGDGSRVTGRQSARQRERSLPQRDGQALAGAQRVQALPAGRRAEAMVARSPERAPLSGGQAVDRLDAGAERPADGRRLQGHCRLVEGQHGEAGAALQRGDGDALAAFRQDHRRLPAQAARLAQVGELGALVLALLDGAAELRRRQQGDVQFAGQLFEGAADVRDFLHAVGVAAHGAPGVHQLQVVDDDQVEAVLAVEAAALGAELHGADGGRIVQEDAQVAHVARRFHEARPLRIADLAQAQILGTDARLGGDHALDELLVAHLHAEDGHAGRPLPGGVDRQGQQEGGLAHAGPPGDDDQVAFLQTAQQLVQVVEAGGDAQGLSFGLAQVLDAVEVLADRHVHRHQFLAQPPLGDGEQRRFRLVDDLVDVALGVLGQVGDLAGRAQQTAADGGALDDVAVDFSVEGGRHGRRQVVQVGFPADIVQAALGAQLFGQRAHVDGVVAVAQAQHGLVDPAMAQDEEILRGEEGADFVQGLRIHQDRAEDGFLRFDAVGGQVERLSVAEGLEGGRIGGRVGCGRWISSIPVGHG